jgi:glutamine amidotransferase
MIAIADYGLGNVLAFANIFRRLGLEVCAAHTADDLRSASKIILPGVGAFDWAMEKLNKSGLRKTLDELVLEKKTPVLGVCVGMQIMAEHSEEGRGPGLGWIKGEVVRFKTEERALQLPHMGWNDVRPTATDSIFRDIIAPKYYFLHSYYIEPVDSNVVLATTQYGTDFVSAIRQKNIFGTQFHPEKSHEWGIRLLHNFAEG